MSDTPRYMCVMPGCPGEHVSKYLCCDFPEHQPGKWVPPLTVNTKGINIGICDATNYRIAWSHFPEYAEAIASSCNAHATLLSRVAQLEAALEQYGQHEPDCKRLLGRYNPSTGGPHECTCGLDAALSPPPSPKAEGV